MKKVNHMISLACIALFGGCFITSGTGKIPYDKILFGKGGGFTGKYDEYFIARNGNIYAKSEQNTFSKINSISAKETKNIFAMVDANDLFKLGFNQPFNFNYYIEIVKGSISNRIVWGNNKFPPPSSVIMLFNKLMGYVNTTLSNQKKGDNVIKK